MAEESHNSAEAQPRSQRRMRDEAQLAEAARRRLVERRILDAMAEGQFENLPGSGKPLKLETPTPGHEDVWWALRMLKQANVTTDEIRYRREIDRVRESLQSASTESDVRRIVREVNGWILKLNTLGTNAIPTSLAPIEEERAVQEFLQHRNDPQLTSRQCGGE